ncbi:hypothetical protein FI667_g17160, partial [Globisporangium splendens]
MTLLLDDEGLEAALSLLDEYDELQTLYAPLRRDSASLVHDLGELHFASSSAVDASNGGDTAAARGCTTSASETDTQSNSSGGGGDRGRQGKTTKGKTRKRPIGFNSNHARDERRKELIYLRQKVTELETQLDQLKKPHESASTTLALPPTQEQNAIQQLNINKWTRNMRAGRGAEPADADAITKESTVWKELASRQHAEREKAEMENIRLKLILEEQIKIAKNLHSMLTKKTTAKLVESFGLGANASRSQASVPSGDDKSIFEDLLRTAEKCYHEIDTVFAGNGLNTMETSYRDAQIKIDDVNGTFLEIIANKVMPFDMHATATAVWQHMTHSMQNIPLRFYYEKHPQVQEITNTEESCLYEMVKMENTDDTVLERIGAELYVNGKKADFQVKQIIRRYVEGDRVVLIWGAYIEALEFCEEPTSGIRFREKGYLMIKRPTSMSSEFTLLQTCYIITPELDETVVEKDPKVGALTEFVLNSTAWNITASHQMIENVLLDQSFKSKRPCT